MFCIIVFSLIVISSDAQAQGRGRVQGELPRADHILIDGNLSDWNTSLQHLHAAQDLQFEIRNDAQYIYVAARIVDHEQQMQAISQGVSFMINVDGKRRDGPNIVFPFADRLAYRTIMSADNEDRPDSMIEGGLQAVRGIFIRRFDQLLDGMISLDNQYGFSAGALVDSAEALCIEVRFPISSLKLNDIQKDSELAFNIKINGLVKQASAPVVRRAPYSSSVRPQAPREERGLWGKFRLSDPIQ